MLALEDYDILDSPKAKENKKMESEKTVGSQPPQPWVSEPRRERQCAVEQSGSFYYK